PPARPPFGPPPPPPPDLGRSQGAPLALAQPIERERAEPGADEALDVIAAGGEEAAYLALAPLPPPQPEPPTALRGGSDDLGWRHRQLDRQDPRRSVVQLHAGQER